MQRQLEKSSSSQSYLFSGCLIILLKWMFHLSEGGYFLGKKVVIIWFMSPWDLGTHDNCCVQVKSGSLMALEHCWSKSWALEWPLAWAWLSLLVLGAVLEWPHFRPEQSLGLTFILWHLCFPQIKLHLGLPSLLSCSDPLFLREKVIVVKWNKSQAG